MEYGSMKDKIIFNAQINEHVLEIDDVDVIFHQNLKQKFG